MEDFTQRRAVGGLLANCLIKQNNATDEPAEPRGREEQFAVGTPVPDDFRAAQGKPFSERTAKERGNRAALLSGVILLVLAFLLPASVLKEQ